VLGPGQVVRHGNTQIQDIDSNFCFANSRDCRALLHLIR
jgi:hypothetical protein